MTDAATCSPALVRARQYSAAEVQRGEVPLEVDADHRVPVVLGHRCKDPVGAGCRALFHEDVEAAELLDGSVDEFAVRRPSRPTSLALATGAGLPRPELR